MGDDPGLFARAVSPDHVRGNREPLEILDLQLPLTMNRPQVVERLSPHPMFERAATSLFSIGDRHRRHDMPKRALRHGVEHGAEDGHQRAGLTARSR
jgi:hypothetical protein